MTVLTMDASIESLSAGKQLAVLGKALNKRVESVKKTGVFKNPNFPSL